ncbi:alpha/beta fold hydrolase [Shewanella cyperi]|uniref:alpha/beta fold hydrolase n=1 Tax=Shewanella cyperi TaxID=2814292 RepID=UPI001A9527A9|nr:alpha/beta fold hydrolase [Shewanella cyperi]QSX39295.1 alpha/beta fold hydrolase [Shewanella cyperi]
MENITPKRFGLHGSHLSYLDLGDGPVLLLGHSYLWDNHMWREQLELLSQRYRVIAVDLYGHGESGPLPANHHSLIDIARDMLALLDSLAIDRFSIIGLSVGAMWGAELALLAPGRVQTLVMLDSFIGFEPEVTRDKYFGMLDIIKQQQAIPDSLADAIVPLFFATTQSPRRDALIAEFRAELLAIPAARIDSLVRLGRMIFGRRDTCEDAEQLTQPCLIMVGTEDKARTVLESYLMHETIAGSQLVHIPQAGHISCLEQPEEVNKALLAFLARHLGH